MATILFFLFKLCDYCIIPYFSNFVKVFLKNFLFFRNCRLGMFLLLVQKEPKYGRGHPDTPIGAPERDMFISFGFISQSDDAIVTTVHVIFVAWCW